MFAIRHAATDISGAAHWFPNVTLQDAENWYTAEQLAAIRQANLDSIAGTGSTGRTIVFGAA